MADARYKRDPDYGKPPNWKKLYGEHFPARTDAYSRHARLIAGEILRDPKSPVRRMLIDAGYEPDHWASAIEATVVNLWNARRLLEYRELPKRGKTELIEIIESLIAAIEWECPPIRDGVEVERRTLILERCAREARDKLSSRTPSPSKEPQP